MSLNSDLNDLSRKELYSIISHLKRYINVLETDLIKFELISNCYQKYFNYFNQINKTIHSKEEILDLINEIKALKLCKNSCFISFGENQINGSFYSLNCIKVFVNSFEFIFRNKYQQN